MTNHPRRRLSPKRRAILERAIANGGKLHWSTNPAAADYDALNALRSMKMIEAVPRSDGRPGAEPGHRSPTGFILGHLYRVTDAGRAALGHN